MGRDTKTQNVWRNWSEGKIERALGYSRRYLADFRWGRFNFDTDVERTKETLIGRPSETGDCRSRRTLGSDGVFPSKRRIFGRTAGERGRDGGREDVG